MEVNSISGSVATLSLQSLNKAVSADQPTQGAFGTNDQPMNQPVVSRLADANAATKATPDNKKTLGSANENTKKPVRSMTNVIEVYNLQGKVRTKFMDSHNNVIYQIPSEMVAKMEDQMMKPDTSTNI
jgi:hypothetical protein